MSDIATPQFPGSYDTEAGKKNIFPSGCSFLLLIVNKCISLSFRTLTYKGHGPTSILTDKQRRSQILKWMKCSFA